MQSRQLKGKTLSNYDMRSVFIELYQIEKMIKDGKYIEQRNYTTIRLVTIIEQFFRKVVEFLFRRHPDKRPPSITLDMQALSGIINTASDKSPQYFSYVLISHSFSFQNTHDIADTMRKYGGIEVFSNKQKQSRHDGKVDLIRRDYDKLFNARHNIVHSITWRPHLDVKRYYEMTEKLMNHTLDKANYWAFHIDHEMALSQFKKNEGHVHSVGNDLRNEIDAICDRATELLKQGKYREAIGDYDKVLLLDPDDHTAHSCKAFSLYLLGEYRESIACFERYMMVSYNPTVYFDIGLSLQKLGEHEDAVQYFVKASEHGSGDASEYTFYPALIGSHKMLEDMLVYTDTILDAVPKNSLALAIKKATQEKISLLNSRASGSI